MPSAAEAYDCGAEVLVVVTVTGRVVSRSSKALGQIAHAHACYLMVDAVPC